MQIKVVALMPSSSNGTFLVCDESTDISHLESATKLSDLSRSPMNFGVFKPERFERPLHDFPTGLWRREIAAFQLSEILSWDLIPPTVVGVHAEFGEGSLQQFLKADFNVTYFDLAERVEDLPRLFRFAVFDYIANNADRKAGHLLVVGDHIWGIDQGLCFNALPKLRTVIWESRNLEITDDMLDDLARAASELDQLGMWLAHDEIDAVAGRIGEVLACRGLPEGLALNYPWPPI